MQKQQVSVARSLAVIFCQLLLGRTDGRRNNNGEKWKVWNSADNSQKGTTLIVCGEQRLVRPGSEEEAGPSHGDNGYLDEWKGVVSFFFQVYSESIESRCSNSKLQNLFFLDYFCFCVFFGWIECQGKENKEFSHRRPADQANEGIIKAVCERGICMEYVYYR